MKLHPTIEAAYSRAKRNYPNAPRLWMEAAVAARRKVDAKKCRARKMPDDGSIGFGTEVAYNGACDDCAAAIEKE